MGMGLGTRLRRFFGVSGASLGEALSEDARRSFRLELAVTRQKREAARHLLHHGARAESLLLARQALASARRAAEQVSLSTSASDPLVGALARELPVLDEEVERAHEDLLEDALAATLAIEVALGDATLSARAVKALKVVRPALAVLAVLALLPLLLLLRPKPFTVAASIPSEPALSVDHVVDGDLLTEWALPDNTPGHVDINMSRPRNVKRLRILDAKSLSGVERGAKELQILVVANGKVEKTIDAGFEKASRELQWITIDVSTADVQRIRVVVKSWFGVGGGLSEIVVE